MWCKAGVPVGLTCDEVDEVQFVEATTTCPPSVGGGCGDLTAALTSQRHNATSMRY